MSVSPQQPKPITIEYLAGFFDGEGCITVTYYPKESRKGARHDYYQVAVSVSNTDKTSVELFHDLWKGNFKLYPARDSNCKPSWRWVVVSEDATRFLEEIAPYLVVKQKAAYLAIELQATCVGGDRWHPPTPEVTRRRHEIFIEVRKMNARGMRRGLYD